jgi:hypothetical protein
MRQDEFDVFHRQVILNRFSLSSESRGQYGRDWLSAMFSIDPKVAVQGEH